MANFHKHGYHGNVKEKSIKRRKHEKISLALSFSHGFIIKS